MGNVKESAATKLCDLIFSFSAQLEFQKEKKGRSVIKIA